MRRTGGRSRADATRVDIVALLCACLGVGAAGLARLQAAPQSPRAPMARAGSSSDPCAVFADRGARLDVVDRKGWTPLTAADGVECTPAVLKRYADASVLPRRPMRARGPAVSASTQPGTQGPAAPPQVPSPENAPQAAAPDALGVLGGVYTIAQATRGQAAYAQACARCHAADLLGAQSAPALVGQPFANRWKNRTLDEVLQTIRRTMPQDAPDSLGTGAYVDIIGYMLKSQGLPAGASELPTDLDALKRIVVDLH
jgi:mono/diheme cytochrome c family protein